MAPRFAILFLLCILILPDRLICNEQNDLGHSGKGLDRERRVPILGPHYGAVGAFLNFRLRSTTMKRPTEIPKAYSEVMKAVNRIKAIPVYEMIRKLNDISHKIMSFWPMLKKTHELVCKKLNSETFYTIMKVYKKLKKFRES